MVQNKLQSGTGICVVSVSCSRKNKRENNPKQTNKQKGEIFVGASCDTFMSCMNLRNSTECQNLLEKLFPLWPIAVHVSLTAQGLFTLGASCVQKFYRLSTDTGEIPLTFFAVADPGSPGTQNPSFRLDLEPENFFSFAILNCRRQRSCTNLFQSGPFVGVTLILNRGSVPAEVQTHDNKPHPVWTWLHHFVIRNVVITESAFCRDYRFSIMNQSIVDL